MRIAIEAQRIFRKNKHGMDFVALETIRELQQIDKENEYFIFVSPGEDKCLRESENVHIMELSCPTYPLWEQIALPRAVKRLKPDLLHCTSNTAPISCPVPLVLTLHDIIFLEKRKSSSKSWYQELGWHYRRMIVPKILPKCSKIITVSHFECNHIQKTLDLPEGRITAIYNGYNHHFRQKSPDPETIRKYMKNEGYLFFLGNTDPKKNTPNVLRGYSIYLRDSKIKRPLLIADATEPFIKEILKAEKIENILPYLTCPGYIHNQDLADLYNGAFTFLYPSLRESFGIPILEAMACGTPVITGNTSAMPEIAGEGGIGIDPHRPEEIAEKLIRLEEDQDFYAKQVQYGLERVKLFSWKECARSLLSLYQQIESHP